MVFSAKVQKARISRNPKTGEKVNTRKKQFTKMAKDLFKKLNNEKNKIFVACDALVFQKLKQLQILQKILKLNLVISLFRIFKLKNGRNLYQN